MGLWTCIGLLLLSASSCMEAASLEKAQEIVLMARSLRLEEDYFPLCRSHDDTTSFLNQVDFGKLQDMDMMFLLKDTAPPKPGTEGMAIANSGISRSNMKQVFMTQIENCMRTQTNPQLVNAVAGLQITCPSDTNLNCIVTLLLRNKTMKRPVAEAVSKIFTDITPKGKTAMKTFKDTFSAKAWNEANMPVQAEICSWKFSAAGVDISFDDKSLVGIMEMVETGAIMNFKFHRSGCFDQELSTEIYEIPSDVKHSLPRLITNLSFRSGGYLTRCSPSLGFDKLSSFAIKPFAEGVSLLKIERLKDAEIDVGVLKHFLQMGRLVEKRSSCFDIADESVWSFMYRQTPYPVVDVIDNDNMLEKVLRDVKMFLCKIKTKAIGVSGQTKTVFRALDKQHIVASFYIPDLDAKFQLLVFMLARELMDCSLKTCCFLHRLYKIGIDKMSASEIVQFSFPSSIEADDLKDAVRYLYNLIKIVSPKCGKPVLLQCCGASNYAPYAFEIPDLDTVPEFKALTRPSKLELSSAAVINTELPMVKADKGEPAVVIKEKKKVAAPIVEQPKQEKKEAAPVVEQRKQETAPVVGKPTQEKQVVEQRKQEEMPVAPVVPVAKQETAPVVQQPKQEKTIVEPKKQEIKPSRPETTKVESPAVEQKAAVIEKSPSFQPLAPSKIESSPEVVLSAIASEPTKTPSVIEIKASVKASLSPKPEVKKSKPAKPVKQTRRIPFKMDPMTATITSITPHELRAARSQSNNTPFLTPTVLSSKDSLAEAVEIPENCILQPLGLDDWYAEHEAPEFRYTVPIASPLRRLACPMVFWDHRGILGDSFKTEEFIRIFPLHNLVTSVESLYYNWNNGVIDVYADQSGANQLGIFKKQHDFKAEAARTRLVITIEDQDVELWNRLWQIAIMLFVDSNTKWFEGLRGIMLDPSSVSSFKMEAWWHPDSVGTVNMAFESAFLEEMSKITTRKDGVYNWEVVLNDTA